MSGLAIATLPLAKGGAIGIAPCPMAADAAAIAAWRADVILTLIEPGPAAGAVAALAAALGIPWLHLPISDFAVPDAAFTAAWRDRGPALRRQLAGGGRVLVHCLAGRGRSGMIAARLLVELGAAAPAAAIAAVRNARPGAIETEAQVAHVLACRPIID